MRSKKELKSIINKGLAANSLARKICKVVNLPTFPGWPNKNPIKIGKEAKIDCIWEDDNEQINKVINKEIIDQVSKDETEILMNNIKNIEEISKEIILGKLIQLKKQGYAIYINPLDYADAVNNQDYPDVKVTVEGIDSRINAQQCRNVPKGIFLIQNLQKIPIMKVKENADTIKNASETTIHYCEYIWLEEVGRLKIIKIIE